MQPRLALLHERRVVRYLAAMIAVAVALGLRILITPVTGTGAPFALFFAAILLTSLWAGTGPGLFALVISLPLAAYLFVVRAGVPGSQAAVQALLYSVDGLIILYLTSLTHKRRQVLDTANHELRRLSDDAARSAVRAREVIELAPEAYFLADLDARYRDVNQAACRLLGYERRELLGKSIFDIIPPEDAERLRGERTALLVPGRSSKAEWVFKRKNGTLVSVEVHANILSDGRWQAFVRDITERKRIEDQRQVFVSLLDNSTDFIGVADPAGTPIYVNPAGRRMVGLSPDYPVSKTRIQEYYAAEVGSFPTDVILKGMVEQGQWSGETLFRNFQTDAAIPVSDTHFMIRDATGERVLGMGTITRDMTEAHRISEERERLLAGEQEARRQAEIAYEQLRESEERFRLTIDEAPIGMALVALDGRFARVNRALCEITGYDADELVKLTFQHITHPDDLDKDVALAGQLARGEIPSYQLEKCYIRKDGSNVDVMLSASLLRGPDHAPLYYIAQVEDITERKRAHAALRLSEAKFSGIVSIAVDAIISVDRDRRITLFNEGAETIFGYSKNQVLGTEFERLIPERLRDVHRAHFARFAAGAETARSMGQRSAVFGLRKNGEVFPAEASISKVSVGGATFFSVVLRDVTYRKNVEAALQRAVTARDEVLRIVAHDLRNPLATIVMAVGSMERVGPEPERRDPQMRQIISRATTRMNRLIQDLLDVALVEAGQLKIEPTRLSPDVLVREVVQMETPLAAASELELRLELGSDLPKVWGEHKRLLQV
ncbi:MAG: PAS domain S-box protein, partial [Gemmatimonadaceae bacterium]